MSSSTPSGASPVPPVTPASSVAPVVAHAVRIALFPARVAFSRTTPQLGRLLAEDGPVPRASGDGERLSPLDGLSSPERPLGRLMAREGTLDRLLEPGGLAERVLTEDGFVDTLIAPGGTLDQLVGLGATLEDIRPQLAQLTELVPPLAGATSGLQRAAAPLGDLASRLPGRRRPLAGSMS